MTVALVLTGIVMFCAGMATYHARKAARAAESVRKMLYDLRDPE